MLVAPLVHCRFVSLVPRTWRHVSLSDLQGRKVRSPCQYISLGVSSDLRSSALMASLPGIALPPCSLSRCSAMKICDPLAVGRIRTSRLAYDPFSYLSLWHPVAQLQPPHDPWLASFCHTSLAAYSTAATSLRLGFLWYCTASLGSCLLTARPHWADHYVVGILYRPLRLRVIVV